MKVGRRLFAFLEKGTAMGIRAPPIPLFWKELSANQTKTEENNMFFDYKTEKKKLKIKHTSEKKIMLDAGMAEEDIREIFLQDYRQLYGDTQFYAHLSNYLTSEQEEQLQSHSDFDIMDERLQLVLDELKPKQREVLLMHIVEDRTLSEIACLLNEPFTTVRNRYYATIKKITEKVGTFWSSTSHI